MIVICICLFFFFLADENRAVKLRLDRLTRAVVNNAGQRTNANCRCSIT